MASRPIAGTRTCQPCGYLVLVIELVQKWPIGAIVESVVSSCEPLGKLTVADFSESFAAAKFASTRLVPLSSCTPIQSQPLIPDHFQLPHWWSIQVMPVTMSGLFARV